MLSSFPFSSSLVVASIEVPSHFTSTTTLESSTSLSPHHRILSSLNCFAPPTITPTLIKPLIPQKCHQNPHRVSVLFSLTILDTSPCPPSSFNFPSRLLSPISSLPTSLTSGFVQLRTPLSSSLYSITRPRHLGEPNDTKKKTGKSVGFIPQHPFPLELLLAGRRSSVVVARSPTTELHASIPGVLSMRRPRGRAPAIGDAGKLAGPCSSVDATLERLGLHSASAVL